MACDVDKEEDQGSLADITLGDYAQFLNELKEKCDSATTFIEKIKYLTAVPASWSLNKTRDFFGVSTYLVKKAKKVKDQFGLFGEPVPKQGHGLSEDEKNEILSIYSSDKFSRIMPGRKDFVKAS